MKKKYRKYIYLACAFLIIVTTVSVLFFKANVSVKDCDNQGWGNEEAYELGYNSHGIKIFKHPDKALKQIKIDCAEGFEYFRTVREMPELTNSFKIMEKYFRISLNSIEESIENREEVQKQIATIQGFVDIYENSNWQHYFPFYKNI